MGKLISIGVAVFLALILTTCGAETVNTGHRGVKVRFGEVIGDPLPEGLYFVNPFTTHISEMDTRVIKWTAETQAYTRDVQQAGLHFTLNFRLDPTKAAIVFRDVGVDWSEKLVGQVIHEEIKREVGQHEAVDIIAQRNEAARKIEANVKTMLQARNVIVTSFQLTNIDFTHEFEQAVEAKVIAQQKAVEEKNRTVQISEQATQKIATARGDADATLLKAKAEAESIRIRAQALEQNPRLVEFEAVKQWNGVLPQYMLGGAAVPFINLDHK